MANEITYSREFFAARVLALVARMDTARELVTDIAQKVVDPDISDSRAEIQESLEVLVETLGASIQSLETLQTVAKELSQKELLTGEPDFDVYVDDEADDDDDGSEHDD